ncbi:hypothetical protein D920_02260 [Enterococcus faecalis 13-SD-W-01]|nr:hypothetical protein D920_02260 [Enterococcus faecalis 13-SD-W-01]
MGEKDGKKGCQQSLHIYVSLEFLHPQNNGRTPLTILNRKNKRRGL